MNEMSIAQQFESFVIDWKTALVCLIFAVIARRSPAGRWNYKRTLWLQKHQKRRLYKRR